MQIPPNFPLRKVGDYATMKAIHSPRARGITKT
jgi:hypothetical protein